jgi:cobalt-zinc-cadmium efflux system protein
MLRSAWGLLKSSGHILLEGAPKGLEPEIVGPAMAKHRGVTEVHDLHVWEVSSGFPSLSAHVLVETGAACHEIRRELAERLAHDFGITHSTLQVEHETPEQLLTLGDSRSSRAKGPSRSTPRSG